MGVKKFIKKSVAFVAAAAMALTMVVAPVGAGAGTSYAAEGTEDNLHLNKGIELQSDGNYNDYFGGIFYRTRYYYYY